MTLSAALAHTHLPQLRCATTLLHILYWSTVDNDVRPGSDWRSYPAAACRLLAPVVPDLITEVSTHSPQHFLGQAREFKALEAEENMKLLEPAEEREAHTPAGHPYLTLLPFPPVERARSLLRLLYQGTDSGGFSVGRSPYSVFNETAEHLLGAVGDEEALLGDRFGLIHLQNTHKLMDSVGIPGPLAKPATFLSDTKYQDLVHHMRWMNPNLGH